MSCIIREILVCERMYIITLKWNYVNIFGTALKKIINNKKQTRKGCKSQPLCLVRMVGDGGLQIWDLKFCPCTSHADPSIPSMDIIDAVP